MNQEDFARTHAPLRIFTQRREIVRDIAQIPRPTPRFQERPSMESFSIVCYGKLKRIANWMRFAVPVSPLTSSRRP